jgi:hypothetical protein
VLKISAQSKQLLALIVKGLPEIDTFLGGQATSNEIIVIFWG